MSKVEVTQAEAYAFLQRCAGRGGETAMADMAAELTEFRAQSIAHQPQPSQDVVSLVIAAREVWDAHGAAGDALDKALEAFASKVRYDDDPATLEAAAVRELVDMLCSTDKQEGCTVFDHTPEEIGLHVMENHEAVLAALTALPDTAALMADNARLREALGEIEGLHGEINPSNYDYDDACELNRQFCYAIITAHTALKGIGHAG